MLVWRHDNVCFPSAGMLPWGSVDDRGVINAGAGDADSPANLAVRTLADAEGADPDAGRDSALRHGDSERSNLRARPELHHFAARILWDPQQSFSAAASKSDDELLHGS